MNPKETSEIKKIKPNNFLYIGIMMLFFAVVIVAFFYSVKFIIKNVNKIFTTNNEKSIHALDISRYSLVEKKLNLPVNIPEVNDYNFIDMTKQKILIETPLIEESLKIEEVTAPSIFKEEVSINILNGARKAGVASAMSKKMTGDGFTNVVTGDNKTIYTTTTVFIKEKVNDFKPSIENIVKESYPNAITKINPDTSKFDVIIIVGKQ